MAFEFDHVHIKTPDPGKTVAWYVKAFDFEIISDSVRMWGDRFIRCKTPDGVSVYVSQARPDEEVGSGNTGAHWGLEHLALKVDDMDAAIKRLVGLGAKLREEPVDIPNGPRFAFIEVPGDVRVELLQYR